MGNALNRIKALMIAGMMQNGIHDGNLSSIIDKLGIGYSKSRKVRNSVDRTWRNSKSYNSRKIRSNNRKAMRKSKWINI